MLPYAEELLSVTVVLLASEIKKRKKDESGFTEMIAVRIKVRENNEYSILTTYRSLVII